MEEIRHDCKTQPDYTTVLWREGNWKNWRIWSGLKGDTVYGISHCPWCGVKLEKPPPVMIEVSREVAELRRLWAIEKVLLSDAGGWISSHEHMAGYFCYMATQIEDRYPGLANHLRRIARVLRDTQQ